MARILLLIIVVAAISSNCDAIKRTPGCRCLSTQLGYYCGAELIGNCARSNLYTCEKVLWFTRPVDRGRCATTCVYGSGRSVCAEQLEDYDDRK